MGLVSEFKEFIQRGNVIDLAVGVVIGQAFGKIVTSLVDDIIMPPIGLLLNGVNFNDIKINIKEGFTDAAGKINPPVTLNVGSFVQVLIQFIIVAFAIFVMVKFINNMRKAKDSEPAPIPVISNEEKLLSEIRDLLKK